MKQTASWRERIICRAPMPLLTQAHEVFIAVAVFLIGLGMIFGPVRPESVAGQVPHLISVGWAWDLFAGSAFTLWGLFRNYPRAEWSGQMFLGWGAGFYTVAIFLNVPFDLGAVVGGIFAALALVSWWRAFKISSAPYIQKRLVEETTHRQRSATEARERRSGHA